LINAGGRDCGDRLRRAPSALCRRCGHRGHGFARLHQPGDRLTDGHDVADLRGDAGEDAVLRGFDFHDGLVGFDFEEHLAFFDLLPLFLQPRHELAGFLRHLERRHDDAYRHLPETLLGQIAGPAGFRIHVLDDREKFASRERFPEADEVIVDSIPDWLHKAEVPPTSYVVVVTRGHRHDLDALRSLAARDLRYIGLIGSKAKVKKIYDALIEEGMPLECLQRVHAPIGLDIGAVSPEEIAVSILAELIAVRRGRMEEPHVAAASLQWKKLPASLAPADKK